MFISVWRNTHLFFALLCSAILLLSSVTGAILAFVPVEHKTSSHHIGEAAELNVADFITNLQEEYLEVIDISIDDEERLKVSVITHDGAFVESYIDGKTTELLDEPAELPWIFSFSKKLHRSLFMGELGRAIVGVITGLFILLLISGLILLSKRQFGFKNILGPVTYDSAFRYWHIQVSRFSFPVILIIGISGVYLSMDRFEWLPGEKTEVEPPIINTKEHASKRQPVSSFRSLQKIQLGEVKTITFPFSPEPSDYFMVSLVDRELYIDQFDGSILFEHKKSTSDRWVDFAFTIHTGGIGIIWPLILLIGSISILFLIVSGFVAFIRRVRGKRSSIRNNTRQSDADYAIYVGSETGSTYAFAAQLHQALAQKKKKAFIAPLNKFRVFENQEVVILTATYGDGDPPGNAKQFLRKLKQNPPKCPFSYCVVGFGSYEYPKFCQFAIDVHNALEKLPNTSCSIGLHKIHGKSQTSFEQWVNVWSKLQRIDLKVEKEEQAYTNIDVLKNDFISTPHGDHFLLELEIPTEEEVMSGDLLAIRPSIHEAERYYSIGVVHGRIILCVKRHESGICSNYLFTKKQGDRIEARIVVNKKFHYVHPNKKTLFIANGTGIAPFLGMALETRNKSNLQLLWGGKNNQYYEFYAPYIEATGISASNLHIALSRQPDKDKTYVQDILKEHPEVVVDLLRKKGTIYICGSLVMQTDVFNIVDQICEEHHLKARQYYQRKGYIKTDCY